MLTKEWNFSCQCEDNIFRHDILRKCKQRTMPSINGPLLAQHIRGQVGTLQAVFSYRPPKISREFNKRKLKHGIQYRFSHLLQNSLSMLEMTSLVSFSISFSLRVVFLNALNLQNSAYNNTYHFLNYLP